MSNIKARNNWDASKERVPQVRALDDPNLGFTYFMANKHKSCRRSAGQVDFLNLIDSQRVLLDFNLAFCRAVADFGINIAELERVVGVELLRKM